MTSKEAVAESTRNRDSDASFDELQPDEESSGLSETESMSEDTFLQEDSAVEMQPSDCWAPLSGSSSLSEDEPPPVKKTPTRTKRIRRVTSRWRDRGRGRTSSPAGTSANTEERWNDVTTPDITPPQPTFRPVHPPGTKLISTGSYTALHLFQLFMTNSVLQTIVRNTNEYGSKCLSSPSTPWTDLNVQDLYCFIAIIIYMGLVKCNKQTDYWRGGKLYSLSFPKKVMPGKKFLRICRSLHLSNSVDDAANNEKKGTATYDRLGKIKPLYDHMRQVCRQNYHPKQNISVDERMVASKARTGLKQYVKRKPVRWGYKLFVLADSESGYTWNFLVYEGKLHKTTGKGLSYEAVMELVDTRLLGTGYKLFVDNFYTSPTLFRDLLQKEIWACGTMSNPCRARIGCPQTQENSLPSRAPRGSIRWIRKDSLLFVQWKDTRDVWMCSSFHTAHGTDTVQRRVKGADGQWEKKDIPIPPAVKDYNCCMGGVDLSDALIGYYKVLQKTWKWYKTFFYHFLDISIVNAFILHKEHCKTKGEVPLNQKAFRETLTLELVELGSPSAVAEPPDRKHHRLVFIRASSTAGRQRCKKCGTKTPVKCSACEMAFCFQPTRDCFNEWHVEHNL
ncbi:piggyBac transposable element-derived protein 4 [Mugil cephalus]|uniref:piggyBac transposable element-derived protein 4 n=1 Tax=Mugil cephalus TaxID=48193 RepID=UPI001FB6B680|nr:piggyBac transposable element-derived protein 4 [Mugil cephalus]